MANGPTTQLSDLIVPEIFVPYVQNVTTEKSALVQSGALVSDEKLNNFLAGEGLTVHAPSFKDLDNDPANVSNDVGADRYTGGNNDSAPKKIETLQETAVRLSRNQSWGVSDLAADLNSVDPMTAIGNRIGAYWARQLQRAFIATVQGVFADNAAAPVGSEHVQNDMIHSISENATPTAGEYQAGVTDFNAHAFLDTTLTMGDAMGGLSLICVHSIVYNRMQKNNLITFVADSEGNVNIPTYLGRRIIIDDAMPNAGGVFDTWLFGAGAFRLGQGSPKTPVETQRLPASGNGAGSEEIYSRVELCIHPEGYQWSGATPVGGPSNAATTGNLAHAASWTRAFPERKQIKMACLKTREM